MDTYDFDQSFVRYIVLERIDLIKDDENLVSQDNFLHFWVSSNIGIVLEETEPFEHIIPSFDYQSVVPQPELLFFLGLVSEVHSVPIIVCSLAVI